jgi:hypothetical protein
VTRLALIRLCAAGGLVVAAVACEDNRAITTEPIGDVAYGVQLGLQTNTIPRGTATFVFPRSATDTLVRDTVRLDIRGLDTLENGFYTVWLGDSLGTSFKRATGTLTVIRFDTIINEQGDPEETTDTTVLTNVSSFSHGGSRHQLLFRTTRTQSGLAATDPIQTLLITIEESATAAAPSDRRRPVWARRGEGTAVPTTGRAFRTAPIRFGTFHTRAESAYVYVPAGRGRAMVRGNVLIVHDSSLTRPPLGYYYAAFAVRRNAQNEPDDTLFLGPQTTPFPARLSLFNADSVIVDPAIVSEFPPAIFAAANRVSADTIAALTNRRCPGENNPRMCPFQGFAQIFVTLESKHKTPERLGPIIILRADLPNVVRNPPEGTG